MEPIKMDSSLTSRLKAILMKAFRERWSDIQWGVHLKRILSSSAGESCDLAEILLQQALVGTNPNTSVISYLKHAVASQVIPASAAFKCISRFEDINRPYCVIGLIELAESLSRKLSFSCSADSAVVLCRSLQSVVHWLMLFILKSMQSLQESRHTAEYCTIIEKASIAVQKITERETVLSLLYIARSEDIETYRVFEQTEVNVRGTLSQLPQTLISNPLRETVSGTLQALARVGDVQVHSEAVLQVWNLPVCPTIGVLVSLEAVLNPTNDIIAFMEQLFVVEKLTRMSRPEVLCELFRACFIGLVDSNGGQEELKWAAFTFLKLPQVLTQLQRQMSGTDVSADLEMAFTRLLNYVPMLDLTDLRLSCDCLKFLLSECNKYNLMSDTQVKHLLQRRINESRKPRSSDVPPNTQPSPSLILRAEPTVTSILKVQTLDSDYSKNQDALLGVLIHMLSGKSFELILAAAAATVKIQSFSSKLIKFNEFARQTTGEGGKAANTRALLFDISFLMLCHITQLYGTEIITASPESSDTFFVQWATKCLPEDGKYKCIDTSQQDPAKVDNLLNQFSVGGELKTNLTKWHDVCFNIPFAIQEVLIAWEHGAINFDTVKVFLDNVKGRMCCLPVVVSAWICSYMNTVGEEARAKPLVMLQQLKNVVPPDPSNQYYNDRSHLMGTILWKMINDILPANLRSTVNQYIPPKVLPSVVMNTTMKAVFSKGWVDLQSLHTLEQLLNLCGSDWFTEHIVKHMLESSRVEELALALSLTFGILHMDLEHLTLSLLLHTVPDMILATHRLADLTDPRGYTLAKLCVMCVSATQTAKAGQKDMHYVRRGRKRSRKDIDLEDLDEHEPRPMKMRKLNEPEITLDAEGFNLDFLTSREEIDASPTYDVKDSLNKGLVNLFRLLNAVIYDSVVSPRTSFVAAFITEAAKCGGHHSSYILQFMPSNMMHQLMKTLPGLFSNQQLLQICDISTGMGRKVAAAAICKNSRSSK